jgi:organic radical activating enzyme
MKDSNNFYCNQKFTWLSIDLEKKLTYSCCTAVPAKIDLKWLEKNPGKIFNTPLMQQERQMMLDNKPVSSCELACWQPESANIQSRRLIFQGYKKTHIDIQVEPEILNIILGSTCNLTCSYCCKQYSTAWTREIKTNGPYLDLDRFRYTKIDQVLEHISQPEHNVSRSTQLLLDEIESLENVKEIHITGGEPLLYNSLSEILNSVSEQTKVILTTGLGVNNARFKNQLSKIQNKPNIQILVSSENIGKFYEFNRYGNSYENFLLNLNTLSSLNFNFGFSSVLSNLTIFGVKDFFEKYLEKNIVLSFCNDPDFLRVNVLDPASKEFLAKQFGESNFKHKQEIISYIMQPYSQQQKLNFSIYLKEFARRRNLDLDIFPVSLLQWLDTN